jgi:hypothetical protein
MPLKLSLFGLGGGKARIRAEDGRDLEIDGEPVEIEMPPPPATDGEELARLRAENARLAGDIARREQEAEQAARQRAGTDADALADRLVASGAIVPAMKAAVATTYRTLALADAESGGTSAADYAGSFAAVPSHGLLGDRARSGAGDGPPEGGAVLPQGEQTPDPIKAAGLDRESLKAVMGKTTEGQAALAALESGKVSWDLVEPVARAIAEDAARASA